MKQLSEAEMLHRAAAYCSTAERCIQDVEKKIIAAGLSGASAERILARLLKEKYIDETRYGRSFVHDKLKFNRWGKVKIQYELRKKNISSTIIEDVLNGIDQDEYQSVLISLLKEKQRTVKGKDKRDVYYKLLRFAGSRGFDLREINVCLKAIGQDVEDME